MPEAGYKRCSMCGESKPLEDFYRDRREATGRSSRCKPCAKAYARAWQEANPERKQAIETRWRKRNPERKKAIARNWAAENPAVIKRYHDSDHGRHPEKREARVALGHAVESGRLVKPARCEDCGELTESRRLHGHHEDYSKPLTVEWLCATCHKKRHLDTEP